VTNERSSRDEIIDQVLDDREAAQLLKVEVRVLQAAARRGEVPGRKVGRGWRFSKLALMRWLQHEKERPVVCPIQPVVSPTKKRPPPLPPARRWLFEDDGDKGNPPKRKR